MNTDINRDKILSVSAYADTLQDRIIGDLCVFRLLTFFHLDMLGIDCKIIELRANQLLAENFDWQTARDVSIYEALVSAGLA